MAFEWMTQLIHALADAADSSFFMVKGVMAVVLVCLVCGMVGSLVVGSGMAFFSDAMAHTAFAGITLGYLSLIAAGVTDADATARMVPLVMILFGAAVGAAMVHVRERTALE